MSETVSVNFSGPALAFLLFENVKSRFEQEGFLLGEINEIVTKTITDSDSHNVKLHRVININAVVPCPRTCAFYNHIGKIDPEKLENILGTELNNVVAWYKYEPENKFKLSVREKVIHKELSTSGLFTISTDLFACCLLSSSNSHMESTHSYVHSFLRYRNGQFLNVPLHISNLGELSNCYKPKVQASKAFSELCQSVGVPKKGVYDLKLIDKIQEKLYLEMTNIMAQLTQSESVKEKLEEEFQNMLLEKDYYVTLIADKALADEKDEEERKKKLRKEQMEAEITNLIDLNLDKCELHLKNDLDRKNKIVEKKMEKTDDRLNTTNCSDDSENLIDLTTEEEKIEAEIHTEEEYKTTVRNKKMSYANMAKKKS